MLRLLGDNLPVCCGSWNELKNVKKKKDGSLKKAALLVVRLFFLSCITPRSLSLLKFSFPLIISPFSTYTLLCLLEQFLVTRDIYFLIIVSRPGCAANYIYIYMYMNPLMSQLWVS